VRASKAQQQIAGAAPEVGEGVRVVVFVSVV
jgi:hypothetical protein